LKRVGACYRTDYQLKRTTIRRPSTYHITHKDVDDDDDKDRLVAIAVAAKVAGSLVVLTLSE